MCCALFLASGCGASGEGDTPPQHLQDEADVLEPEQGEVEPSGADVDEAGVDVEEGPLEPCVDAKEGAACVSDSPCSKTGTCQAGLCVPDTPCACQIDADCAPPDDLCAGVMVCDTGAEAPTCVLDTSQAVSCPASELPCQVNQCEPETGACALVDAPEGQSCDDGDACTTEDACSAGVCVGPTPLLCDDGAFATGLRPAPER